MNNCKIKNISENNITDSQKEQKKQIELTIETPCKTDKIQLSGKGSLKVSAPV